MAIVIKQASYGTPPIVTNGLVLYLDTSNQKSYVTGSTVWNDMSGNAYSASMSGSVPYSGSQQPPYFSYSGGTYDFQGSSNLTSSIVNEVTIVSVATITNLAQRSVIFNKYQATGIAGYLLEIGTVAANWTNTMRFYAAGSGSGQTACDYRGSTQLVANKPYMFTAVYSKTNNTVAMYYNNLVMPATQAGVLATVGTNWSQGPNKYAVGSYRPALDGIPAYMAQYNVILYNRALSHQEIIQNYNALKTRFRLS